jgi:hypothetical protein
LLSGFNSIIGGLGNLIDANINTYIIPGYPETSAGIKMGSAPYASVAHGVRAKAHVYNQIAHGGGTFDGGTGEAQTSVVVVSTEIAHDPYTATDPTDPSTLVMSNNNSQILTPYGKQFSTADPSVVEDGLSSAASNFYYRAITVPANTIVSAKLTWVASWSHPSFTHNRCVTGEIWGLFRMGSDSGERVDIVAQGYSNRAVTAPSGPVGNPAGSLNQFQCEQEFESFLSYGTVGYGVVYPRIKLDFKTPGGLWGVHDYAEYPIRVVGRLELTQVYQQEAT